MRLQVVAGRLEEASAAIRSFNPPDLLAPHESNAHPNVIAAADVILEDSVGWFIRHNDYASARRWALMGSKTFGIRVPNEMKPVLATGFDELYGDSELGLTRVNGTAELGNARLMLDAFSAHTMIRLSHRPEVGDSDRRAMAGAAWTRAYAMDRWADVTAWLPELRSAFPELADAVRRIEEVQDGLDKRHLLTHLLLKAPGLVAFPSWSRPPGGKRHFSVVDRQRPSSISAFDTENPNDGNWWCQPDADGIRVQTAAELVGSALDRVLFGIEGRFPPADSGNFVARAVAKIAPGAMQALSPAMAKRATMLADADRAFALYPILSTADLGELTLLSKTGSATRRLAGEAVEWAKVFDARTAPADEGLLLAESLASAVMATRYGCHRGPGNGALSKAAYDALHRLFPKSEWAKRTPAWFK